jgi:rare lipoprotein A
LSGKHAEPGRLAGTRTPRPFHKFVPLVSAVALAAVLVGAATAAMTLGPTHDVSANKAATTVDVTTASPSRSSDDRSSRSGLRALATPVPASSSASPTKPSATPSTKKATPTPPSGGGTVTSKGSCQVSYYGDGSHTADGEVFDPNAFTAAHKTLPFNTRARVTNPANGKSVVVRITDRGPFVSGRCLDLTTAAFKAIASLGSGVITANYEVLG